MVGCWTAVPHCSEPMSRRWTEAAPGGGAGGAGSSGLTGAKHWKTPDVVGDAATIRFI